MKKKKRQGKTVPCKPIISSRLFWKKISFFPKEGFHLNNAVKLVFLNKKYERSGAVIQKVKPDQSRAKTFYWGRTH